MAFVTDWLYRVILGGNLRYQGCFSDHCACTLSETCAALSICLRCQAETVAKGKGREVNNRQ